MKSKFEKLKKKMTERRSSLLAGARKSGTGSTDDRKGDDIDLAESAYEQEMAYMMRSRESEELQVLNVALKKMEDGEYGICDECDEMIGAKRLEAMPFVKCCVDCQSKMEHKAKMEAAGLVCEE